MDFLDSLEAAFKVREDDLDKACQENACEDRWKIWMETPAEVGEEQYLVEEKTQRVQQKLNQKKNSTNTTIMIKTIILIMIK